MQAMGSNDPSTRQAVAFPLLLVAAMCQALTGLGMTPASAAAIKTSVCRTSRVLEQVMCVGCHLYILLLQECGNDMYYASCTQYNKHSMRA